MLPLGDHSSHWANLLGKIVREFPMHFGSWRSILAERKAGVLGKIRTQCDLKPHMQSELWPEIKKGIDQHLGKIYTDNKSSLKRGYWVKHPDDETYDGLGTYIDDQIMAIVREVTFSMLVGFWWEWLQKQIDMIMKAMSSDDRMSQLFTQLQSQHEIESGSGSGAGEDDESSNDENTNEDDEDANS
nr:hypothetical protein [Tanacetum cinerariifolium]